MSLRHLSDLLLTRDPVLRPCLSAWTVSTLSYVLYGAIAAVQVRWGFASLGPAAACVAAAMAFNAVVYALIRSGWSSRRFPKDPGLGVLQLCVGVALLWVSYAVAGPAAGTMLIIVSSHMVWAVFSLTPRRVIAFAAVSVLGIGATMAVSHWHDPQRYGFELQWIGFLYVLLVVPLIARLSVHVSGMQQRLRRQSRDLAEALARVQALATCDELTGLHNRRHMAELLQRQHEQLRRVPAPLCVALLDIDFFKSINDRFGHRAGDAVLRRFAGVVAQNMRTTEVLARWGGEEFMVLFSATELDAAAGALRRLAQALHATAFDDIAPGLRVSFSAGVVALDAGETVDAALERADQAMYRAKSLGRDRIEVDAGSLVPA